MNKRQTLFQAILFGVILTAIVMLLLSIFFYWFSGYFDGMVAGEYEATNYASSYFERAAIVLFSSAGLILIGAFLRHRKIPLGKWILMSGSALLTLACLLPVVQFSQNSSAASMTLMAIAAWLIFTTPHALLLAFLWKQAP